jgi:hypothetical protein
MSKAVDFYYCLSNKVFYNQASKFSLEDSNLFAKLNMILYESIVCAD